MVNLDILHLDIFGLSCKIRNKEISPVEITQQLLKRIEQINPSIQAFITVASEEAITSAKKAEAEIVRGEWKGHLHGVPIGLKDLIYTKDIRTTMGSKIYRHFVPDFDATVVQKLKNAGAILIGKLNTHEFAYGPTGDVSFFGPVRNPYNTNHMSGGSSSGSGAAVASALCFGALGTDTGGSIRIPSSACGIVGMKPTFGRVSKHGVYPLGYTLDHVGPMTRTIKDNALLLNVLAGYDPRDPYSRKEEEEDFSRYIGDSVKGMVIGVPSAFYFDCLEDEVRDRLEAAVTMFQEMGAQCRSVDIPVLSHTSWAQLKTLQSEAYTVHEEHLKQESESFHPEVLERLMLSAEAKGYEYVQAQMIRRQALESFEKVFEHVDVLVTPTLPILPPEIGQREIQVKGQIEQVRAALLRLTGPTNLTGLPSLSMPCGFSATGLPIGMQLISRPLNEAILYQFGAAFENAAGISSLKWEIEEV
ncbi:Asp-tRNA(Asn)/Glu-tRNA(Gln) amidotransferase GatCAB subunit A [Aneurinibacillus migulanus]|uniref:Aspartyl-tRNA(Asn)/glutamyl-tRNA(Gln) amidotransferase subunit A n=1 Tax=Aneurinibacillus migulanus TaxID=47500 RepID=A0A0M0H2J3_ANEMI|nr:Asp-tRNA(Asn)/Glu-tRNA(Gln) amidotransferase GatCAB subunit A [Aneurinibacillus migulanus]KON95926.1 glutamyl-tRNA amidotransferase [Aneurinibacillus migulanus]MED0893429.1 Asp-tRNA(Asn)/Glu-tRNA(Gln) amidotransferase GatCAB subunit A [Aneurinibacillus migulanus]MED1618157.1 Asp-tRNA(Asn)/Glu-tRNA(Gln) amidotransferase GatCAB subunit A [Aneurinibacillus migulanus]SDJ17060.1 aspartyl-tRNA(Asn)/glutamyl-tRNA(Gln) amidotransferase subunit A [Aneurinibacillus migulanus]GED16543.1 amidase [Aneur